MSEEEIKGLLQKNIDISEKIFQEVEKQRKIRKWTLIIGIIFIVLPLILALVSIPWIIGNYESYYGDILGQ